MKWTPVAQLGFIILATLAVYMFVRTSMNAETRHVCAPMCSLHPNYAARNRLAPDFELETLSGGRKRLSDYAGQVVIMNFWSKTCPPCLEEMPSLAELAKQLHAREGMTLITVNTDESAADARDTLASVVKGTPPFPVFMDPGGEVAAGKYGTKLYPETWFIDPEGVIRARVDGAREWAGPLVVEFVESLKRPGACKVEFLGGEPRGDWAPVCQDVGGAG